MRWCIFLFILNTLWIFAKAEYRFLCFLYINNPQLRPRRSSIIINLNAFEGELDDEIFKSSENIGFGEAINEDTSHWINSETDVEKHVSRTNTKFSQYSNFISKFIPSKYYATQPKTQSDFESNQQWTPSYRDNPRHNSEWSPPKWDDSNRPAPNRHDSNRPAPNRHDSNRPAPNRHDSNRPAPNRHDSNRPAPNRHDSNRPAPNRHDSKWPAPNDSNRPAHENWHQYNRPDPNRHNSKWTAPSRHDSNDWFRSDRYDSYWSPRSPPKWHDSAWRATNMHDSTRSAPERHDSTRSAPERSAPERYDSNTPARIKHREDSYQDRFSSFDKTFALTPTIGFKSSQQNQTYWIDSKTDSTQINEKNNKSFKIDFKTDFITETKMNRLIIDASLQMGQQINKYRSAITLLKDKTLCEEKKIKIMTRSNKEGRILIRELLDGHSRVKFEKKNDFFSNYTYPQLITKPYFKDDLLYILPQSIISHLIHNAINIPIIKDDRLKLIGEKNISWLIDINDNHASHIQITEFSNNMFVQKFELNKHWLGLCALRVDLILINELMNVEGVYPQQTTQPPWSESERRSALANEIRQDNKKQSANQIRSVNEIRPANKQSANQIRPASEIRSVNEIRPASEIRPANEIRPAIETQSANKIRPASEIRPANENRPANGRKTSMAHRRYPTACFAQRTSPRVQR
eukprot:GHVL01042611.1.p1 GENE.GHVL01042611.1~~GHVL01042611.1.p1  ORF type:complete len:689 (-),score=134.71 GHVL01042611.1:2325-4391(-)